MQRPHTSDYTLVLLQFVAYFGVTEHYNMRLQSRGISGRGAFVLVVVSGVVLESWIDDTLKVTVELSSNSDQLNMTALRDCVQGVC